MSELEVTWIEVAEYIDGLLRGEKGRKLVMAKALKFLLFRSFLKCLKPEERTLMKALERELTKRKRGSTRPSGA